MGTVHSPREPLRGLAVIPTCQKGERVGKNSHSTNGVVAYPVSGYLCAEAFNHCKSTNGPLWMSVITVLFFFSFLVEPRDGATLTQIGVACLIGLGRTVSPYHWRKYIRGNALCTHPLAQASVGLISGRRTRWTYLLRPGGRPDTLPTKTPGCLHHSRWGFSVFVEHFVQPRYTF